MSLARNWKNRVRFAWTRNIHVSENINSEVTKTSEVLDDVEVAQASNEGEEKAWVQLPLILKLHIHTRGFTG